MGFFALGILGSAGVGSRASVGYLRPIPVDTMESDVAMLCRRLGDRCEKKGFKGAITELETIEAATKDENLVPALISLINGELSVTFEKMVAGPRLRKIASLRVNEVLKEKGWVDKTPDVKRTAPDFFPVARWEWVAPDKTFQLSLRVVRCNATADFVESTQLFTIPSYIESQKVLKDKTLMLLIGCGAALLLCLTGFVWMAREVFFDRH